MSTNVPDMTRGNSLTRGSAAQYARSNGAVNLRSDPHDVTPPAFAAQPPERTVSDVRNDGRKKRALGLVPAKGGAQFPILLRSTPKVPITMQEVSLIRAELRRSDAAVRRIESELTEAIVTHGAGSDQTRAKQREWEETTNRAGVMRRKLADAETGMQGRPEAVHLATVREPHEVADALANTEQPPFLVCMHEGERCKGKRWTTEVDMRRDHGPPAELVRRGECHVYAYVSETPLDVLDPDGPKVGYIAPVGTDGTVVRQLAAEPDAVDMSDDVDELRARLDALTAELAAFKSAAAAAPPKKG